MNDHIKDMLRSARKGKGRSGKTDLINHLKGIRITRQQAIRAKCFDCDGMGDSGSCELINCPLYPYSPYQSISTINKDKTTQKAS